MKGVSTATRGRSVLLGALLLSMTGGGTPAGATHEPPPEEEGNPCNVDGHRDDLRGTYVTGETVLWLDGNDPYFGTASPGGSTLISRYVEYDGQRGTFEAYFDFNSGNFPATQVRLGDGPMCVTVAGQKVEEAPPFVTMAPGPPPSGPHGVDYPYPLKPTASGPDGLGGYTLYEPNPLPSEPVPILIMLRGACTYGAGTCDSFNRKNEIMGAWRDHLVRKGNIVVFPHYQNADEPDAEMARIADAFLSALNDLSQAGHATPDVDRIGMFGVSRGSQMTSKVASNWDELGLGAGGAGLPNPKWLLIAQPGPTSEIDFAKLADIPASTKVVVIVGEDDQLAGETKAKNVWDSLGHIPAENKDYVRVRSDVRGMWTAIKSPEPATCELAKMLQEEQGLNVVVLAGCYRTGFIWQSTPTMTLPNPAAQTGDLTADHFFLAGGNAWTLEIFVGRKFAQGLIECTGGDASACDWALGDTPMQRFMGIWSDGQPVKELCITDDPDEPWSASCS